MKTLKENMSLITLGLLQTILLVLKLCGLADFSWHIVLLPSYFALAVLIWTIIAMTIVFKGNEKGYNL